MLLKRINKKDVANRTVDENRYVSLLEPFHEMDTEQLYKHFLEMDEKDIDWLMEVTLHHSFFQFSPAEVQFFNCYARKHKTVTSEQWGVYEWANQLGIVEVPKDDRETPYLFSVRVGDETKKYRIIHNTTNRGYSEANASRYGKFMVQRRWADNGEVVIFDHTREIASAQHRGKAAFAACLGDATLKIPVTVVRGIPRQLIGSVETGRKRTKKDETSRFKEILHDVVRPLGDAPNYGSKQLDKVTKVNAEMVSAIDAVILRANGKDVHNSTTGIDADSAFDFIERSPEFPSLVARCYAYGETFPKNKGPGHYSPAMYATALCLYSNSDNPSEVTILPGVGRVKERKEVELPDYIDCDLEFSEKFLSSLNKGWMQPVFDQLDKNKGKYKKHHKMLALIKAIKHFEANCFEEETPPPIDPATGEVFIDKDTGLPKEGSKSWNCAPLPSHGFPVLREDKVWDWETFGGLDLDPKTVGSLDEQGKEIIDTAVA